MCVLREECAQRLQTTVGSAEVPVLVSLCWFLLSMARSGALAMSALFRLAMTMWSPKFFGTMSCRYWQFFHQAIVGIGALVRALKFKSDRDRDHPFPPHSEARPGDTGTGPGRVAAAAGRFFRVIGPNFKA